MSFMRLIHFVNWGFKKFITSAVLAGSSSSFPLHEFIITLSSALIMWVIGLVRFPITGFYT